MGTRAIYTFEGFGEKHHVFVHYDGYLSGAAGYFSKTLEGGKVWGLPRYEPDEFAAGFVASVKDRGGNVRLAAKRTAYLDVEYGYTVEPDKAIPSLLRVTVTACDFYGAKKKETKLWSGPLVDFIANAADIERRLDEA
jgi:hypothetical protein